MNLPGLLNVPHSFNIQTSLSSMTCREGDKGDPSTQSRYQDAQPDDLCRLIQDGEVMVSMVHQRSRELSMF